MRFTNYVVQVGEKEFFLSYKKGGAYRTPFVENPQDAMLYGSLGAARGVATNLKKKHPDKKISVVPVDCILRFADSE